jgi:hypothetical protein
MSIVHARELADTRQAVRLQTAVKRCRYCGAKTRSSIGVCLAHDDLPDLDPLGARSRRTEAKSEPPTFPGAAARS